MRWIADSQFLTLMNEIYNLGETTSYDLKDQVLKNKLFSIGKPKKKIKYFSISQLMTLSDGSTLFHPLYGNGIIKKSNDMSKVYVRFDMSTVALTLENQDVWNFPLFISETK